MGQNSQVTIDAFSAEAFRYVLLQEADPGIARKRIISEIASERLPVKTASGFLPYDQVAECVEQPEFNWLEVDFQDRIRPHVVFAICHGAIVGRTTIITDRISAIQPRSTSL